jgi:hypothetical protein
MISNMKHLPFLLLLILPGLAALTQEPDWRKATHWTIYNVQGKSIWKLPIDSLDQYAHQPLNNDSMTTYLTNVSAISPHGAAWMGVYVTTCVLDNKKRKVDVSAYGGFFYDELLKRYFEIPVDLRRGWYDYLASLPGIETTN